MHRKQALHSMRQSGIFLSLVFTAADVNYLNGETSFLATDSLGEEAILIYMSTSLLLLAEGI